MKNNFLLLFSLISCTYLSAQVGINTERPHNSSLLDVSATDKGILLPRIDNLAGITNPAHGLVIFDKNRKCLAHNIGEPTAPDWVCISPYVSKIFYMPSVVFDTSLNPNVQTKDLYDLYKLQFGSPQIKSPSAPVSIPFFPNRSDLYYYITAYDDTVFENLGITDNGVLSYKIKSDAITTSSTYINIVFVVK